MPGSQFCCVNLYQAVEECQEKFLVHISFKVEAQVAAVVSEGGADRGNALAPSEEPGLLEEVRGQDFLRVFNDEIRQAPESHAARSLKPANGAANQSLESLDALASLIEAVGCELLALGPLPRSELGLHQSDPVLGFLLIHCAAVCHDAVLLEQAAGFRHIAVDGGDGRGAAMNGLDGLLERGGRGPHSSQGGRSRSLGAAAALLLLPRSPQVRLTKRTQRGVQSLHESLVSFSVLDEALCHRASGPASQRRVRHVLQNGVHLRLNG
mmetsp:Transcript_3641/g.8271  ORF Transcript_3641/g.8271 Transcript_3641/m.8271 type:complete len:267 (-) Transcript_3641:61-861(-)